MYRSLINILPQIICYYIYFPIDWFGCGWRHGDPQCCKTEQACTTG